MNIEELARAIEARLVVPSVSGSRNIEKVYGGITMSDLLANAAPDTLLVTCLNNIHLARVADLMEVPGICLVDGREPDAELVSHARATGKALLVANTDMVDTCARATRFVAAERAPRPCSH